MALPEFGMRQLLEAGAHLDPNPPLEIRSGPLIFVKIHIHFSTCRNGRSAQAR